MENIKISTGQKEYALVGSDGKKVSIWLNPSDTTFVDAVFNLFNDFQERQETIFKEIDAAEPKDVFATAKKIDAEMREKFMEVFGEDIVTPLIGKMSLYALAEGTTGVQFPVWANILLALIKKFESELTEEQKKSAAKIAKYTKKYHK